MLIPFTTTNFSTANFTTTNFTTTNFSPTTFSSPTYQQPCSTSTGAYAAPRISPDSVEDSKSIGEKKWISDQAVCRTFPLPTHVARLTDSQIATLEVAFSENNFGKNITIWQSENSSEKLRETARLINSKLSTACPSGLQIDLNRLCSTESNTAIYDSKTKSIKGTISFPVKPEDLSYVDTGEISCLLIDVKTVTGRLARIDISKVTQALEVEYLERVKTKLRSNWSAPTYQ